MYLDLIEIADVSLPKACLEPIWQDLQCLRCIGFIAYSSERSAGVGITLDCLYLPVLKEKLPIYMWINWM